MTTSRSLLLYVIAGAVISALAVAIALVAGHSGGAKTVGDAPASTVVETRSTKLGTILVDAQGRTLYLFAKDTGAASTCSGSCASYWPPVPVTGQPHVAGQAAAADLQVITRGDGRRQLSYAGHPLYYFRGDHKAGQTTGQALNQFGAKWYALDPAGAAVTAAPSSGGGNGNGYY